MMPDLEALMLSPKPAPTVVMMCKARAMPFTVSHATTRSSA